MQAGHHIDALLGQSRQRGVFAVGPVAQEDVALFELIPQRAQHAQIVMAQAAAEDLQDRAAVQAKEHRQLHDRKAAAGFLRGGLGIARLVFRGVGQLGGGAVDDDNATALEAGAVAGARPGGLSGGGQSLLETLARQASAGLDRTRIPVGDGTQAVEAEEGLDLADDLAAGGLGLEHLPDEALEGQAQAENPVAAVGTLLLGAEQRSGQEVAEMVLELGEGGLADGLGGAAAEGGQAGAPGREIRSVHVRYIYWTCLGLSSTIALYE